MGDSNSSSEHCFHFDHQTGCCSLSGYLDYKCNRKPEQSYKTCDNYKEECLQMAEKLKEKNRQMEAAMKDGSWLTDPQWNKNSSSSSSQKSGNFIWIGSWLALGSIVLGILFGSFAVGIIGVIVGTVLLTIGVNRG